MKRKKIKDLLADYVFIPSMLVVIIYLYHSESPWDWGGAMVIYLAGVIVSLCFNLVLWFSAIFLDLWMFGRVFKLIRNNNKQWIIDVYKLAIQGDLGAQYMIGIDYDFGIFVKQNKEKAIEWYEKAAEQGHAKSQYMIGKIYHNRCRDEKVDNAKKWYDKAIKQGYTFSKDEEMGEKDNWLITLTLAKAGQSQEQYTVGKSYYDNGSIDIAKEWLEKSAKQGNVEAQNLLKELQSNNNLKK